MNYASRSAQFGTHLILKGPTIARMSKPLVHDSEGQVVTIGRGAITRQGAHTR